MSFTTYLDQDAPKCIHFTIKRTSKKHVVNNSKPAFWFKIVLATLGGSLHSVLFQAEVARFEDPVIRGPESKGSGPRRTESRITRSPMKMSWMSRKWNQKFLHKEVLVQKVLDQDVLDQEVLDQKVLD